MYNIDYNRCIFCGYCVEACPTDAITHGHGFELASLNATSLVMRKEDLLVPTHGLPDAVASDKDEAEDSGLNLRAGARLAMRKMDEAQ